MITPPGDPGDPGNPAPGLIEKIINNIPKINDITTQINPYYILIFPLALIIVYIIKKKIIISPLALFFHKIIIKISITTLVIQNFLLDKIVLILCVKGIKLFIRLFSIHSGYIGFIGKLIKIMLLIFICNLYAQKTLFFTYGEIQNVLIFSADSISVYLDKDQTNLAYTLGQKFFHFSRLTWITKTYENEVFLYFFHGNTLVINAIQDLAYFFHNTFILTQNLNFFRQHTNAFIFYFSNMDTWEICSYTLNSMDENLMPNNNIAICEDQIMTLNNSFSPEEREKSGKVLTSYLRSILNNTVMLTLTTSTVMVVAIFTIVGIK